MVEMLDENEEWTTDISPLLHLLKKWDWNKKIENMYLLDFALFDPQERILLLDTLQQRYLTNQDKIPQQKRKFIELKNNILQTWFDVKQYAPKYRLRSQWNIHIAKHSIKYDVFANHVAWTKERDGQWRIRFPLPALGPVELLGDITVDKSWHVEWIAWINLFKKIWDDTYQIWMWWSAEKKVVLTARIKTIQGNRWTKNIINYTINDKEFSMRNDITYSFLEKCALLLSIKSNISPNQLSINPVVGLEYTF